MDSRLARMGSDIRLQRAAKPSSRGVYERGGGRPTFERRQ
jgi:hypothetical protein